MNDSGNSITVKILGQEYKIKCPPDKMNELQESANYLNKMMLDLRDNTKIMGIDKIAVLAALNVTHEMLSLKKQKQLHIDSLSKRIQELQYNVEQALLQEAMEEKFN